MILNPATFCLDLFTDNIQECTGQLAALGAVVAVQFIIIILLTIYIVWLKRRGKSCAPSLTIKRFYFIFGIFFFDMGEGNRVFVAIRTNLLRLEHFSGNSITSNIKRCVMSS